MAYEYKPSKFMSDAVIEAATSLGVSPNNNVANLARSGQLGTGVRLTKLDGASPLVFNPATIVVLSTPSFFDKWPKLKEMLVALIETHAKSISGIDVGYSLETADTPIGHDGQTLKVPTRVTRSTVDPSMTFQEMTGNVVWNIFRQWLFCIQNPDTNASSLPANISNAADIPEWVASAYSMSIAVLQYDPTGLADRLIDAAVISNMFPTQTGELGFERSIGTTKTMERSISFTGYIQHNENTRELGRRLAAMLNLHKINMEFAVPGIGGSVDPAKAIEKDIQNGGGVKYEAQGANGSDGAIARYHSLMPGGDNNYSDRLNASDPLAKTPAV